MKVDQSIVDSRWKRYSRPLLLGLCLLHSASYVHASQDITATKTMAEQGNATAQNDLGDIYFKGEGVPKDLQQAVSWYRKAADQGNAYAQLNLGYSYCSGEGVTKDFQQASSWFRKAAEQGNTSAQTNLGLIYLNGDGVAKDLQQAASWFRKAAEQGFANAQARLGNSYLKGEGVPRDLQQAAFWYRKAAEQGYAKDQTSLALKQIAAIEHAEADAKLKMVENAKIDTQLKALESANDLKYSGGLSAALESNKDKGLDWFKSKLFKLDKASTISMCDPGMCYILGFNGASSLGITQEKEDFNGRQLQGQFVRIVGTDRFGTLVATRVNTHEKASQKPRPASPETSTEIPSRPRPVLSTYDEIVSSIDDLIRERTAENWTRPSSARHGMTAVLQINMLPDGTVTSANIAISSGDISFDKSAVAAVKKISPLSEMNELKPSDYQPYRSFKMNFTPDDLDL